MFGRILIGLIGMAIGILMVLKTETLLGFTGHIGWIEEHLRGFGGTRMFYNLLGILIVLVSLMYMTGMLQNVVVAIFGRFFGLVSF